MRRLLIVLLLLVIIVLLSGCSLFNSLLSVMFYNYSTSEYDILSIQLKKYDDSRGINKPTDSWGPNLIPSGESLAPDEHFFFDVEIPNLKECQYRITINDPIDGDIIIDHSPSGSEDLPLLITHWGSAKRTVGVLVKFDDYFYDGYVVSGWNDSADWDDTLGTTGVSW
ncbi:MAG: hypothetical protein HQ557_16915 [Bacteroidetes bacterium]|nr:hypothetical protein [Bacteroidota bacterium]